MRAIPALVLSVLLVPLATTAQVSIVSAYGEARLAVAQEPDVRTVSEISDDPLITSYLASSEVGGEVARASGYAQVRPGALGVEVWASSAGEEGASSETYLRAFSRDTLTFDHAGLAGQSGQVTVAYRLGGNVRVEVDPAEAGTSATASLSFTAGFGDSHAVRDGWVTSEGPLTDPWPGGSVVLLTADIVWGQAIDTFLEGYAAVWSRALGGTSLAHVDATDLALWGGIVSATHDGQAVTGFTVSSLSGTDYSRPFGVAAPVPEPAPLAMGLAGLVLAVGAAKRRGSRYDARRTTPAASP